MVVQLLKSLIHRNLRSLLPGRSGEERLFLPTRSRWLWNESRQWSLHTVKFNIEALKGVVAAIAGRNQQSDRIKLQKLADGANNKVLIASVGRRRFVVKIPFPFVPRRYVTASEVATLDYLQSELHVPVPKVLAWQDTDDNPVGCEYIIMEEAEGQALQGVWPKLNVTRKSDLVHELIVIQKRFHEASQAFQGYGSLYFKEDAARLGFSKQLNVSTSQPNRFCIGPLAHRHFLSPNLEGTGAYGGPWATPEAYSISVAQSSMIQSASCEDGSTAVSSSQPFSVPVSPVSDVSAEGVCRLLKLACEIVPHVTPQSADVRLPILWHPDLHSNNIFLSPEGCLTGIIDWQGASILPLYLSVRQPQFLYIRLEDCIYELPHGFKEMPQSEKTAIWESFNMSMLQGYYSACFREDRPAIATVLDDMDINPVLRRLHMYAQTTNRDEFNTLMLRNELIRVQRHWASFATRPNETTTPACPLSFSSEEIKLHGQDASIVNSFRDIIEGSEVKDTFALEGWAPAESFNEWHRGLQIVIQDVMQSLANADERAEFKERLSQWSLTKR